MQASREPHRAGSLRISKYGIFIWRRQITPTLHNTINSIINRELEHSMQDGTRGEWESNIDRDDFGFLTALVTRACISRLGEFNPEHYTVEFPCTRANGRLEFLLVLCGVFRGCQVQDD